MILNSQILLGVGLDASRFMASQGYGVTVR